MMVLHHPLAPRKEKGCSNERDSSKHSGTQYFAASGKSGDDQETGTMAVGALRG